MEMTTAKAQLVRPDELDATFAPVLATLPRAEFEEVLRSGEPADLLLDVQADGGEQRTVSVAWEHVDLERILGGTDGSEITLAFGRDELEQAWSEPDVEAHGLRERALVLTVVAATAAAGGARAAAAVDPAGAGGQATVTASAHDELGSTARGIEATTVAAHDEAGTTARGIVAPGTHDEATLASRGISTPAVHDEATLASRGIELPTVAVHDEATLASRGIGVPAASHDEATLASRGIEPTPVPSDGGFAIEVPTIDATTAAVVGGVGGGLVLLITAAGFAARRDRMSPA
jgi:hypothetical protein